MTREEAVHAMYMGKKVRHRYFGPDEWMTIENYMVVTEDGCKHYPFEFWKYRFGPGWDDGYELVESSRGMKSRLKLLTPLILGAAVDDKFYMNDLPRKKDSSITARVIPTPEKELREFNIKGCKIMAYSRKDAIKRLKHKIR